MLSLCECLSVNQGGTIITAAHRDLLSCMHRPTNKPWSHTENQFDLTYFAGQMVRPTLPQKVVMNRHFQASWASQCMNEIGCLLTIVVCCYVVFTVFRLASSQIIIHLLLPRLTITRNLKCHPILDYEHWADPSFLAVCPLVTFSFSFPSNFIPSRTVILAIVSTI